MPTGRTDLNGLRQPICLLSRGRNAGRTGLHSINVVTAIVVVLPVVASSRAWIQSFFLSTKSLPSEQEDRDGTPSMGQSN
uniref:Uncharacterized protein n=1 Tax=Arundo donax TaxID=35708 RepID=A0A0A8YZD9_ARUDO